jgi:hypothetical protein
MVLFSIIELFNSSKQYILLYHFCFLVLILILIAIVLVHRNYFIQLKILNVQKS